MLSWHIFYGTVSPYSSHDCAMGYKMSPFLDWYIENICNEKGESNTDSPFFISKSQRDDIL